MNKKNELKKRRLIYVLPKINYFNEGDRGRVTHALGIAEGFAENNWTVHLLSGPGVKGYKGDLPETVNVMEVRVSEGIVNKLRWIVKLILEFRRLLYSKDPHVFLIRYAVSKYFVCWLLCVIASRKGLITVLEVNSFAFHHPKIPELVKRFLTIVEIYLSSRFDVVYAVSNSLTKMLQEKKCTALIVLVPNGASSKLIEAADQEEVTSNQRMRIVYLGSLHSYYDFDIIFAAFKILVRRRWKHELHFFGSGEMEEALRKLSEGEPGIFFHGRYKKKDVGQLLRRASDIMILPPKIKSDVALSGGLSTKLFEYMSLNMPIVAPAMGEVNDILKDEQNAILYNPDSAEVLANRLEQVFNDTLCRQRISKNAHSDFIDKHTWRARMFRLIHAISRIEH